MNVPGFADLAEIGRGGFATVYRARQVALGRAVAVKVLARHDLNSSDRMRFEREASAMAALGWHPHVVTIFDAGATDAGALWIAMELLESGSMADVVAEEGRITWPQAVRWSIQLASALDVAHEAGILHRDVKPQNALVSRTGDVKLGDFGIVAFSDSTRTATGAMTGTVLHSAPEVLNGARATVASDVYSLGSTLWELLTGWPAFHRSSDDLAVAIALRVIQDDLPPLDAEVPDGLTALLHRSMAKAPDDRFASAAELAVALQQVEVAQDLPATPIIVAAPPRGGSAAAGGPTTPGRTPGGPPVRTPGGRTGPERRTLPPAVTPIPPLPEPLHDADRLGAPSSPVGAGDRARRRRRALVFGALGLVVVLVAAAAAWALSGGGSGDSPVAADDFGGGSVDLTRWTLQTGSPAVAAVELVDGRLVIASTADQVAARGGLKLTCQLLDFDARVDLELLSWPTGSGARAGFEVQGANTSFARADYQGSAKLSFETLDYDVDPPTHGLVVADTDAASGELRIVRTGGTVKGLWRPSGSSGWQLVGTGAVADTMPATIFLSLWDASGAVVRVAFDDFSVSAPGQRC